MIISVSFTIYYDYNKSSVGKIDDLVVKENEIGNNLGETLNDNLIPEEIDSSNQETEELEDTPFEEQTGQSSNGENLAIDSELNNSEFILVITDQITGEEVWGPAMDSLSGSCIDVVFRINEREIGQLNELINEMESRNYKYYVTAGASDFGNRHGNDSLYWDRETMCDLLKNESLNGLLGLYAHETMVYSNSGKQDTKTFDWARFKAMAKCASENNKLFIVSEFSDLWGWRNASDAIKERDFVRKIFTDYGDSIVYMWANNINTTNPTFQTKFNNVRKVVDELSNEYNGKQGGSIQDWHWRAVTGQPIREVPASDIFNYSKLNFESGGEYYAYGNFWNNPGFFDGLVQTKELICE